MKRPCNAAHHDVARTLATLLFLACVALSGCTPLQQGLSKAVVMDYDQTTNFREYELQQPVHYIQWSGGASETGIEAYYPGSPTVRGFWAAFIICNVRNEGSAAESFPFNMNNFYVTYDGKDHFYTPLAPYTFSSYPLNLSPAPGITPLVNQYFRQETNLGPENDTFPANSYVPSVNYRFAIYVTKTSSGPVPTDMPLSLRYKNYPNVMNNRGHVPQTRVMPTRAGDLATVCRAPA